MTFETFAHTLADISGKISMEMFYQDDLSVESKENLTPVTHADRTAEWEMRKLIEKRYPDHNIIGEEYGKVEKGSRYTWVLDPIDGTISFIHRSPLFGNLIALLDNGKPILGVINMPALGRRCIGNGVETKIDGKVVRMRETSSLGEATLLATDIRALEQQCPEGINALKGSVKYLRTWGDCFGYLLLAEGRADIMIDAGLQLYDVAALAPIIEGAGGVLTGWDGSDPLTTPNCFATCKTLHGEVMGRLHPTEPRP